MLLTSWLQSARTSLRPERGRRRRRALQAARPRLQVLTLEDRSLPSFTAPVPYSADDSTYAVVSADFNNDTFLDVATANLSSSDVSVLLGKGDGTFQDPQSFGTDIGPWGIVAADLNNDRLPDLVTANLDSADVSVLVNTGTPPTPACVGDCNGDGMVAINEQ